MISIENEISYSQAKRIGAVQGHLNLELFRFVQVFYVFLILLLQYSWKLMRFSNDVKRRGSFRCTTNLSSAFFAFFLTLSSLYCTTDFPIRFQTSNNASRVRVCKYRFFGIKVSSTADFVCSEMVKWLLKIVLNADCI